MLQSPGRPGLMAHAEVPTHSMWGRAAEESPCPLRPLGILDCRDEARAFILCFPPNPVLIPLTLGTVSPSSQSGHNLCGRVRAIHTYPGSPHSRSMVGMHCPLP